MIRNYLSMAMRQLLKNRIYLLINVLGMGIAIACAMTAYLLVAYNLEFDSAVNKEEVKNIVKVVHHRQERDGDPFKELVAPLALAPSAAQQISGIKNFTRFCSSGGYLSYGDKGFHETIFFADSGFMSMFHPPLVSGSHHNFRDRNSIFISEKFASKYFRDDDPLGKDLVIHLNNKSIVVTVGGVLADMPFNSTFTEDVLMRIEQLTDARTLRDDDWTSDMNVSVLFELSNIRQAPTIAKQMNRYVSVLNALQEEARSVRYELLPFMYALSPNDVRQSYLHLRIPAIALTVFATLGGIILLIACFNLTNTTLALAAKRLKEIGIRKVVGSGSAQIALQFFIEIMVTITIALLVGFALSLYLIPEFASMWQLPYGVKELNRVNIVLALLTLLFSSALLAGMYPAIFGSRMSPVLLFKGWKNAGGTNFFIRTLLAVQFALSIVVLIACIMFHRNAVYQDALGFGYDKDMLITALIQGPHEAQALSNAISSNPNIENTAAAIHHFAFINAPERNALMNGETFKATVYEISPDYFSAVGLKFVSGKSFGERDSTSVVVDENFCKHRRLENPLASRIDIEGASYSIAGVVTNHLTDLESNNSEDYIYKLAKPENYQILVVRAEAENLHETKVAIDRAWKKLFPSKPLRTDLQRDILYEEANAYNDNLRNIFLFLTTLGCLLSLSGLYAMARLNIHRRTREIGIRKVLGASISEILALVNTEFAIILLIAGVLGSAAGYYITDGLLSSLYAQRISVGAVPLLLCSMFVVVMGLLATSITILRAAAENPVKTLRSE